MIDAIPKNTGNGYLFKASNAFPETFAEFRAALISGTLPIDINYNATGWQVEGSALNKANLLPDSVSNLIGLTQEDPQIKDALTSIFNVAISGAKSASGTYEGSGNGIQASPKSLTFNFTPKAIIIINTLLGGAEKGHLAILFPTIGCVIYNSDNFYLKYSTLTISAWGNTCSWYSDFQEDSMDLSGDTFNYIAIG